VRLKSPLFVFALLYICRFSAEMEEANKKAAADAEKAANTTPDYAAGLVPSNPPTPAPPVSAPATPAPATTFASPVPGSKYWFRAVKWYESTKFLAQLLSCWVPCWSSDKNIVYSCHIAIEAFCNILGMIGGNDLKCNLL
jgi:hypothetical protein